MAFVTPDSHRLFRTTVFVFAAVLGCLAVWILAPAYVRFSSHDFRIDAQAMAATPKDRYSSALAASVGFFRGDLWSQYALTYLNLVQPGATGKDDARTPQVMERAYKAADRSLALAPYDARIWLLLSALGSQITGSSHQPEAALRMSYYTGANETELIPSRLRLALRSDALPDSDFQQMIRHDLQIIITKKPEMKPAIAAAYQGASPAAQKFLDTALSELDPDLLSKIRPRAK